MSWIQRSPPFEVIKSVSWPEACDCTHTISSLGLIGAENRM